MVAVGVTLWRRPHLVCNVDDGWFKRLLLSSIRPIGRQHSNMFVFRWAEYVQRRISTASHACLLTCPVCVTVEIRPRGHWYTSCCQQHQLFVAARCMTTSYHLALRHPVSTVRCPPVIFIAIIYFSGVWCTRQEIRHQQTDFISFEAVIWSWPRETESATLLSVLSLNTLISVSKFTVFIRLKLSGFCS